MRLQRFYVEQKIKEGEMIIPDQALIHQLSKVFRSQTGDRVVLFDGSGFEYEAEIISLNKKEVNLKVKSPLGRPQGNPLAKPQDKEALSKNVSLYLSLIKKSNFELAAEKCTEIGVTEIHPIISERSEKKDLNIERLNKIVKEASEQSGRMTLPKVFEIVSLDEAVSQAVREGKEGVVFHTNADASTAPNPSLTKEGKRNPLNPPCQGEIGKPTPDKGRAGEGLCLFIGPEGGWTEKEIELFKKNKFKFCSLGQNILRAETAAMVAMWRELNI